MKLELSRQIFGKKSSNIKFRYNPSSWSRADGHIEANSRFSQFCERALKDACDDTITLMMKQCRTQCDSDCRERTAIFTWRGIHALAVRCEKTVDKVGQQTQKQLCLQRCSEVL
jgi:hypothetical protein